MHLKRLMTAAVALPLLILLIIKGSPLLFSALIATVAVLGMKEYFRIVTGASASLPFPLQALGYLCCPAVIFAANHGTPHLVISVVALSVLLSGIFALTRYGVDPSVLDVIPKMIQGVVYLPLLLSYLVFFRGDAQGHLWIFLLLILVFSGDTGAFYVGKRFGKHKLCPSISPGKTVEGFFGGLSATLFAGILYKVIFLPELSLIKVLSLSIAIGLAGPLGDLYESALKRRGMIKDSGNILPGHGGILDRIDALLFAAPLAYLFKIYIF